jgi:hypothetical protein
MVKVIDTVGESFCQTYRLYMLSVATFHTSVLICKRKGAQESIPRNGFVAP